MNIKGKYYKILTKKFVIEEYAQQGYIITLEATCSGLTILKVKSDAVTIEYTG